jgi:hypothetical protein
MTSDERETLMREIAADRYQPFQDRLRALLGRWVDEQDLYIEYALSDSADSKDIALCDFAKAQLRILHGCVESLRKLLNIELVEASLPRQKEKP